MEITTENILNAVRAANRDQYHFMYGVPVKVLHGFEIDLWRANRRKVLIDYEKHWKIDGIVPRSIWRKDKSAFFGIITATTK